MAGRVLAGSLRPDNVGSNINRAGSRKRRVTSCSTSRSVITSTREPDTRTVAGRGHRIELEGLALAVRPGVEERNNVAPLDMREPTIQRRLPYQHNGSPMLTVSVGSASTRSAATG